MKVTLLSGLLFAAVFASHFPYEKGNQWMFSYIDYSFAYMGGNSTDSGTVFWELDSLEELPTALIRYRARIIQEKSLIRRSKNNFTAANTDTTYSPPLITKDTLYLRITVGINGIEFEGDSCWSFVHDPDSMLSEGMAEIRKTKVFYDGDSIDAVEVDPLPCRDRGIDQGGKMMPPYSYYPPIWFITADNIGPVGYYRGTPEGLMDIYWEENWNLIWANLDGGTNVNEQITTGKLSEQRNFYREGPRIIYNPGNMISGPGSYMINGKRRPYLSD